SGLAPASPVPWPVARGLRARSGDAIRHHLPNTGLDQRRGLFCVPFGRGTLRLFPGLAHDPPPPAIKGFFPKTLSLLVLRMLTPWPLFLCYLSRLLPVARDERKNMR